MTREQWLARKGHSCESIRCETGEVRVLIVDPKGRSADGFGATEKAAFAAALSELKAKLHRAGLTLQHVAGRQEKPL